MRAEAGLTVADGVIQSAHTIVEGPRTSAPFCGERRRDGVTIIIIIINITNENKSRSSETI